MTRQHRYLAVFGFLLSAILFPQASQAEFGWDTVDIHGFLSQGYMKSSGNNIFADTLGGTFQLNEFGLNFSTDLNERLHVGLQFFFRDVGDFGNNTIKLDWAYADFRWRDWLGFRAGRIKTPAGLHMETADLDMLRTYIFLPQSLYSDAMRDVFIATNGISIYGFVPLGQIGDLTYQLTYGNSNLGTDGTMALYMESEANARLVDVEDQPIGRAHIEWLPPIEGLRIIGSALHTDIRLRYATTENTFWAAPAGIPLGWEFSHVRDDMIILDSGLEWVYKRLTIMAEYEYQQTNVHNFDQEYGRSRSAGYYAGLGYRVTDRWELGTYYSVYYDDLDDKDGSKLHEQGEGPRYSMWQKSWILATRFDVNDSWLIKGEIHLIDGSALFLEQHNPEGAERQSVLFALKTTYSF